MKKKVIAIPALLVIAAGMTYWFFGYEEKLPEPGHVFNTLIAHQA